MECRCDGGAERGGASFLSAELNGTMGTQTSVGHWQYKAQWFRNLRLSAGTPVCRNTYGAWDLDGRATRSKVQTG
jgi:hypothetical protein